MKIVYSVNEVSLTLFYHLLSNSLHISTNMIRAYVISFWLNCLLELPFVKDAMTQAKPSKVNQNCNQPETCIDLLQIGLLKFQTGHQRYNFENIQTKEKHYIHPFCSTLVVTHTLIFLNCLTCASWTKTRKAFFSCHSFIKSNQVPIFTSYYAETETMSSKWLMPKSQNHHPKEALLHPLTFSPGPSPIGDGVDPIKLPLLTVILHHQKWDPGQTFTINNLQALWSKPWSSNILKFQLNSHVWQILKENIAS